MTLWTIAKKVDWEIYADGIPIAQCINEEYAKILLESVQDVEREQELLE